MINLYFNLLYMCQKVEYYSFGRWDIFMEIVYKSKREKDWLEKGFGSRFDDFQNLMRFRVRDVLIVSSLYDFYMFEEDGRLYELLRSEYQGLNLSHTPELTRVSSAEEALEQLGKKHRYDLVIVTLHIEDAHPALLARQIREQNIDIPVVLLASENRELADIIKRGETDLFDEVFVWLGDFRLVIAIIKSIEDKYNVDHDTRNMGVQSIIVVEDNIRYYSTFLPAVYIEVMNLSRRLIKEGINISHKNLRQRARPKILLCTNYEDALGYYQKYKETILGIISDFEYRKDGKKTPEAGLMLARHVLSGTHTIPILLHSSCQDNEAKALGIGCDFLLKESPTLLRDLRHFMEEKLGFGDFVFRMPDGKEVARAENLVSLEKAIMEVPAESFAYHAEHNHFSNWLKARTEFWLAHKLRPRKISEFPSIDATRNHLQTTLHDYRKLRRRGMVTEFSPDTFDTESGIARIGSGSLGGKARGLSFINKLMNNFNVGGRFNSVRVYIPPAVAIATDVFDDFLDTNGIREYALKADDDQDVIETFVNAGYFPGKTEDALRQFLTLVRQPIAVRSSSLLEDSHNHPFAGVYETYMLPNSHEDIEVRLSQLITAIKKVYASTYYQGTRHYLRATSFRLEEEKMAIIVQVLCGRAYGNRFYPTFSGTAQSNNFYPVKPQKPEDGIVSVSLGLGKMVVEGGSSVRFCPKYPNHVMQFSTTNLALKNNQHDFFALDLCDSTRVQPVRDDECVRKYDMKQADEDGVLRLVSSTYSAENDRLYDSYRPGGYPVVTFAPVLKHDVFPLADITAMFLELGSWSMATPVELEFAVNIPTNSRGTMEFAVLQVRPMVMQREIELTDIDNDDTSGLLCKSDQVTGNGVIDDVYDIVMVDRETFDRSKSRDAAEEVAALDTMLIQQERPYVLIGVGRWGTMDPWLGIPVRWESISGARAIVESNFKGFSVSPSQGSHFFENLISFSVGYFTVQDTAKEAFMDWQWLRNQSPEKEMTFTRLYHFDKPVVIKMDGTANRGVIYKP